LRICIILLIISISCANAQETTEMQDNARVSVYIHPLALFSIIFNTTVTAIYSTIEVPLDLSSSLIVKPSFLSEDTDLVLFKLGSDIGMRHYLFGKGEGLYLQEQIGIFYYKCENVSVDDTYFAILALHPTNVKGFLLDAMGYLGYSLKFPTVSVFADIGFGFAITEKSVIDPRHLRLYPLPDFNLGIGIPF
jgi:hypothetical protein